MRRRRTWLVGIAVAYLAGALVIGLWPTPVDAGLRGQIAAALGFLHHDGIPNGFGYATIEFSANVLFFVPIGVLSFLLLPFRLRLLAVPIGALISGAIELTQLLLLPARFASWNDILANTLGTVVGVLIVLGLRGIRRARVRQISSASRATSAVR